MGLTLKQVGEKESKAGSLVRWFAGSLVRWFAGSLHRICRPQPDATVFIPLIS
ncbi:hypothetical protein GCM10010096_24760 [Alcaligenes pakistanensis]|uniref:Uncharacterized protein n=1 Tax=Alcaligenes pakistanensis TaxID=1482717 RepID=A0A8H9M640_9BURK|nr:hypothetical protein GCM10010096_24760 [Alcaligenes pakistanensis]